MEVLELLYGNSSCKAFSVFLYDLFVYDLMKLCAQINPHVASILVSHNKTQKYHLPRQEMPSNIGDASRLGASMASISAFAFQGTNAHVVLCRSAFFRPSKLHSANNWHHIRAW